MKKTTLPRRSFFGSLAVFAVLGATSAMADVVIVPPKKAPTEKVTSDVVMLPPKAATKKTTTKKKPAASVVTVVVDQLAGNGETIVVITGANLARYYR